MRISAGSNLVLKYGRKTEIIPCNQEECENLHICLINVTAAIRVFVLLRRLRFLKKSQRMLYALLKTKFELAIESDCDFISLKPNIFHYVNHNLEMMRDYFIQNGEFSYAIEAQLGILIDLHK